MVLVVEDDESLYDLLSEYLASRGYSVFGAGKDDEALALVEKLHPQVVILDHEQPSLGDDFLLARRLRANDPAHHLPILLLTAHVERRLDRDAIAAGCDGVMRKPFHLDNLADELRRLVDH